ncbi:MAG: hypothetical protein JXR37_03580, partial [Kiritimatiellae bacterium]|nr:hypothetical protein [Kiritimatiellia bacterium]
MAAPSRDVAAFNEMVRCVNERMGICPLNWGDIDEAPDDEALSQWDFGELREHVYGPMMYEWGYVTPPPHELGRVGPGVPVPDRWYTQPLPPGVRRDAAGQIVSAPLLAGIGDEAGRFTLLPAEFSADGQAYYTGYQYAGVDGFAWLPFLPVHRNELVLAIARMKHLYRALWAPVDPATYGGNNFEGGAAGPSDDYAWAQLQSSANTDYAMSAIQLEAEGVGAYAIRVLRQCPDDGLSKWCWANRVVQRYQADVFPAHRPYGLEVFFFNYARTPRNYYWASSAFGPRIDMCDGEKIPREIQGYWHAQGDEAVVSENAWTLWDRLGPTDDPEFAFVSTPLGSLTNAAGARRGLAWGTVSPPVPAAGETKLNEAPFGYEVAVVGQVVTYHALHNVNAARLGPRDVPQDGLVAICPACTGGHCLPSIDARHPRGNNTGLTVQHDFGYSSPGPAGITLHAYMVEYEVDGETEQMFSMDTAIIKHVADQENGRWEFATVKRPSGAEVIFSLKGSAAGQPVDPIYRNYGYRLHRMPGNTWELRFGGASRIVHVFNSDGKLEAVRMRHGDANTSAAVFASPSPTHWPGMTVVKSGDGAEISRIEFDDSIVTPTYSGELVVGLERRTPLGEPIEQRSVIAVTDARGYTGSEYTVTYNPTLKVRVLRAPAGHEDGDVEEIWRYDLLDPDTVAQKEIRTRTPDWTTGDLVLTDTTIVNPGQSTEDRHARRTTVRIFAWGEDVTSETVAPGTPAAETTTYAYYDDAENDGDNFGRLKLETRPDGAWTRYEYDDKGRLRRTVQPFGNAAPEEMDAARLRIITYHYAADPSKPEDTTLADLNFPVAADQVLSDDDRPRLVIETACGVEVARTYTACLADRTVVKRCATPGAAYDAAGNLTTETFSYPAGHTFAGRLARVLHANGTLTTYSYELDIDPETTLPTITTTVETGAPNAAKTSVVDGTRSIALRLGRRTLFTRAEDIASGITLAHQAFSHDRYGRVTCDRDMLAGLYTTNIWDCCGLADTRDLEGVWTLNTADGLKRVSYSERLGVTTAYEYDSYGNITRTQRTAPGETPIVTSAGYDEAGRMKSTTDACNRTTSYLNVTNEDSELEVTTTYPDGTTRIETHYRDGRLKCVGGSAVHPLFHEYGADPANGGEWTRVCFGADSTAAEWEKTYTDMLGRQWKTEYPDGYAQVKAYNALGQQVKQTDGITTRLFAYNAKGEQTISAVDMNGNGVIDSAASASDRITEFRTAVIHYAGKDVRETTQSVYPNMGDGATRQLVARRLVAVDGTVSWDIPYDLADRAVKTSVARNQAAATRTTTVTYPDGTRAVSEYRNGRLETVRRLAVSGAVIVEVTYAYDAFGRQATVREPDANGRERVTRREYYPDGAVHRVSVSAYVEGQGGPVQETKTTEYRYDAMGRLVKTINPDLTEIHREYWPTGEVKSQTGARTYPVTYTYDPRGRMRTLSTYRNGVANPADTTTWHYDSARGWLTRKVYAGESDTTDDYLYSLNGALKKRIWERGAASEYFYDAAGDLTRIVHTDLANTSEVVTMRDRLGRAASVSDANGVRASTFRVDGQLDTQTAPPLGAGYRLDYDYDALGRRTALRLLDPDGATVSEQTYAYDPDTGRLAGVSGAGHTVAYTYAQDGVSVAGLAHRTGGHARLATSRAMDGFGRITAMASQPSAGDAMSFAYRYNGAGQRERTTMADGSYWEYAYDTLGQLTSGRKHFADGREVAGRQFVYGFDTIGNRKEAYRDTGPDTRKQIYTANALNQYEQRTVPGRIFFSGEAAPDSRVSVRYNDEQARPATRQDRHFWQALDVDNSGGPVHGTATITATRPVDGETAVTKHESRDVFLPPATETFAHDADGNLVQDGQFVYKWNAENRLIAVETRAGTPDSRQVRLEFAYDSQGRRVSKRVYSWTGSWTLSATLTFVYDGWNLIAEFENGALSKSFVWGLDLSGTLQGAGGIGGLLMI